MMEKQDINPDVDCEGSRFRFGGGTVPKDVDRERPGANTIIRSSKSIVS